MTLEIDRRKVVVGLAAVMGLAAVAPALGASLSSFPCAWNAVSFPDGEFDVAEPGSCRLILLDFDPAWGHEVMRTHYFARDVSPILPIFPEYARNPDDPRRKLLTSLPLFLAMRQNGFLVKPFGQQELLRCVDRILKRRDRDSIKHARIA